MTTNKKDNCNKKDKHDSDNSSGDVYNEEDDYDEDMIGEGRKKTGTPLCARGIASAKATYDVYPSAYANGHAIQVCKGKMKGLDGETHCSGAYC